MNYSRYLLAALIYALPTAAFAQCSGLSPAGSLCGNAGASSALVTPTRTPVLGLPGSVLGSLGLAGNTSGTVTIKPQPAAGTYNFNLPSSAGTSGLPLLSAGGGSSPMTFSILGSAAGGFGIDVSAKNGYPLFAAGVPTFLAANTIDARLYGVVCDGSTANATPINNALTAAAATAATVVLPLGACNFGSTLNIPTGVTLMGQGGVLNWSLTGVTATAVYPTRLVWTGSTSSGTLVSFASHSFDAALKNLTIDGGVTSGNLATSNQIGVLLQSGFSNTIERVSVQNSGNCFRLQNTSGVSGDHITGWNTFRDMRALLCGTSLDVNPNAVTVGVTNNFFYNFFAYGYALFGINFHAQSDDNHFHGCYLSSGFSNATGIIFNSSSPTTHTGVYANHFTNCEIDPVDNDGTQKWIVANNSGGYSNYFLGILGQEGSMPSQLVIQNNASLRMENSLDPAGLLWQSGANATYGLTLRNSNAGSAAGTRLVMGNDANSSIGALQVNSSTNTAVSGANSFNVINDANAPIGFWINSALAGRFDSSGFTIGNPTNRNSLQLSSAAASSAPALTAVGVDADIQINMAGKGTGGVSVVGPLAAQAVTNTGRLIVTGAITPTALVGDVNDYAPTGFATAFALRVDGGASDRNITGIAAGVEGRIIAVVNIGTTNNLVLKNQSGSSSAANQFLFGEDLTIAPNKALTVRYDGTSSRWRAFNAVGPVISSVASGGTGRATLTNHGVLIGAGTSAITQLAVAAAGTVLGGVASSDPAFTPTPVLGAAGTTLGSMGFSGNTSGVVTITPQAAAGTYNYNLPITAGTSGQVQASGGGGAAPMTWTTLATVATSGSASDLGSGTLAAARGGAGTINGALKGNGSGVVSQAACADLSNGATGCSTAVGTIATQNYTASTWTPTFVGQTTPGTGQTYSVQSGSYEQIGRLVIARFFLTASSLGTAAGNLLLGGLPVAQNATSNDNGTCYIGLYTVSGLGANSYGLTGYVFTGSTSAVINQNTSTGTVQLTVTQAGAAVSIMGTCVYHS